jgi:hypothetical protein
MAIDSYIQSLALAGNTLNPAGLGQTTSPTMGGTAAAPAAPAKPQAISDSLKAAVDAGSLLSFVDGLTPAEREDVLYSVQLAHRSATHDFDRFAQTQSWYLRYIEILQMLGWVAEQMAFASYDQSEGELRMDKAALAVITAIATQNQLAVLKEAVGALEKLAENDNTIRLFDFHTSADIGGNFQIGAVQKAANGALSLALGSFYFRSHDARRRFLFAAWGKNDVNFWTAAQKMTLNATLYARGRDAVKKKLEKTFPSFIAELQI